MAVPKRKTSRSRRNMRRGQDTLNTMTVTTDSKTGERHLRHHISPEGRYRGRQVLDTSVDASDE